MKTILNGLAVAGLATAVTVAGIAASTSEAEAHGKHRHRHGLSIHIGDGGYYGGYGRGCGWLRWKWEETGHPKWHRRWQRCRYGW